MSGYVCSCQTVSEEKQQALFHGNKPCYCHPGKKS
jgi:hypothetical protein